MEKISVDKEFFLEILIKVEKQTEKDIKKIFHGYHTNIGSMGLDKIIDNINLLKKDLDKIREVLEKL